MNTKAVVNADEPASLSADLPPAKAVPAVRRAAAILWLLADSRSPLSLSEIARAVEILPSTALHILRELASAHLISIDDRNKRYSLGHGITEIAQVMLRRDQFTELARDYLERIAERFGVTATGTSIIDDEHAACVVSVSSTRDLSLNVIVGGRVPRLAGAAGRCIAAFSEEPVSRLKRDFARIRWQTPLDFQQWLEEVDEVRHRGFAADEGLFSIGVTTLAAPIFNSDRSVTHVIGIVSISATLNEARKAEIAAAMMETAGLIGAAMSGS